MPGNDEKQKKLGENSSELERETVDSSAEGPPEGPEKMGAPTWIVTFSDLMSLLMCFFVMLLSMSTIDVDKFKAMLQGLDEGLNTNQTRMEPNRDVNKITREQLLSSLRSQKQQITDVAKLRRLLKRMIMDKQVELLVRENQIVIRILQGGSFQAGKAELKKQFMPVAKKLRKALGGIEGAITVTGHTDDRPIKSKRFRSNWELAGARAYSVMHELLRKDELKMGRFVLNGAGATEPIESNETRRGRERNRRVEIEIDQKNTSYREKAEALGQEKKDGKASKAKAGGKKNKKVKESKKKKKIKRRKKRKLKRRRKRKKK